MTTKRRSQSHEDRLAGTELLVEKLIPEGNALGRLEDGRVVILRGAVPGDRVVLERAAERKGLVRVQAFRVIERSAARVVPRCPVFNECGGCDWMMLSLEQQRVHKLALLREALLRTAKVDLGARAIELVAGASASGYRRRVRLQVVQGRVGFYARGSHALVEPERCEVSSAALNAALRELRQLSVRSPSALERARWLELREACDGSLSVFVEPEPGRPFRPVGDAGLPQRFRVAVGAQEAETASQWQRFELTRQTYLLAPPSAFTQVNWEVNRALIERILAGARARGIRSFLDAYAGCGNFALPLLADGLTGVAIESNRLAVIAAREAARRQGLPDAGFVVADSAQAARELRARRQRFDLVLLDPPRAGVKHGLSEFSSLTDAWLALVSCNPATLARDVRALLDGGFELDELVAFDMFPETHHLESLAWLRAPRASATG